MIDRLRAIAREFIVTLLRHQVTTSSTRSGRKVESEGLTATYNRLVGLTPDVGVIEGVGFQSLIAEVFAGESSDDRDNRALFLARLKVVKELLSRRISEREMYKDARANLLTNEEGTGILDKQIGALNAQADEKFFATEILVQSESLTTPLADTFIALLSAEADTLLARVRKLEVRRRSISVTRRLRQVGQYAKAGVLDGQRVLDTSLVDFVDELVKLCSSDAYRRQKIDSLVEAGKL